MVSRRTGRNDFTQRDDENLMKYIAQVRPEDSGRQGNNIYIQLEQSADQRPWAKQHPWQSWRERYRKNKDWFNHTIKKYQKKLKEDKKAPKLLDRQVRGQPSKVVNKNEQPAMVDKPSKENDESSRTEVQADPSSSSPSESDDETDSEEESASETGDREELYMELFGISQDSEDSETLDGHERLLAPSSDNVNQDPNVENVPRPGTMDKEPGSFDGVVKIESTSILPRAQKPAPESVISSGRKSTATGATIAPQPTQPPHYKPQRKLLPRDDDSNFFGTPSPSPPPPTANSITKGKPPTLLEGPYRSSLKRPRATSGNVNNDESWPPKRRKKTAEAAPDPPRPQLTRISLADVDDPFIVNRPLDKGKTRARSPARKLMILPNPPHRHPQPTRISPAVGDPFIVNRSLDKGKKRASSPIRKLILDDKPHRIDLRQTLNNSATRSSIASSRTSMSSTSRHSVTSFLLPEDQEIVNQVGFPEVMAVIAKHYGFDVDVAMNAFFATKSIEKTKSVLQYAKEVANSATNALLGQLVNQAEGDDVDSCGDEEPQTMRRRSLSSGKDQGTSSGRQEAKRSSGSRKAKRPSLNIKPRPFDDEEIDQNALSDYSPPHVSRAGQFMRLVKQGRRKEAVDRERRRASGAFVAQTQTQSYDEDQRQHFSSHVPKSSTLNSDQDHMSIDSCDNDDFEAPVVTPDTVQHQPPVHVSPPVDHHRIFFKRVSDGQSTLNDSDDPAVLKLAQEHRDLVMDVTEENADALRTFEQKNNQDLLRLWSLDWVKHKIANM
ncbi:hypothetical protein BYT27DRAFT_7341694 [Phlegmacium glaucopus]|nr:hypothetical protein BYT27DRAFT_7341694 [Phlegmacium glaucopus]